MSESGRWVSWRAASIGTRAQAMMADIRGGVFPTLTVHSVFARSFYLAAGDRFILVAEVSVPPGPLAVILDANSSVAQASLRPGDRSRLQGAILGIGSRARIDLARADVWQVPPWPTAPARLDSGVLSAIEAQAAASGGDRGGLLPLVLGRAGAAGSGPAVEQAFQTAAVARLAALEDWLDRIAGADTPTGGEAGVLRLVGFGPGLTPSGDDLIAGVLAAVYARASCGCAVSCRLRDALAATVRGIDPAATSPLSYALLREAAAGRVDALVGETVTAMASANIIAAAPLIQRLSSVGHSSGADTLAGIILALRVAAGR